MYMPTNLLVELLAKSMGRVRGLFVAAALAASRAARYLPHAKRSAVKRCNGVYLDYTPGTPIDVRKT